MRQKMNSLRYNKICSQPTAKNKLTKGVFNMSLNDINSLSHTKWNCKYHIVFAPKYRRKIFYYEKREAIGKILRMLCEWKGVKIIIGSMSRSYTYVIRDTAKDCNIKFYGLSKRKKQYDDV